MSLATPEKIRSLQRKLYRDGCGHLIFVGWSDACNFAVNNADWTVVDRRLHGWGRPILEQFGSADRNSIMRLAK